MHAACVFSVISEIDAHQRKALQNLSLCNRQTLGRYGVTCEGEGEVAELTSGHQLILKRETSAGLLISGAVVKALRAFGELFYFGERARVRWVYRGVHVYAGVFCVFFFLIPFRFMCLCVCVFLCVLLVYIYIVSVLFFYMCS